MTSDVETADRHNRRALLQNRWTIVLLATVCALPATGCSRGAHGHAPVTVQSTASGTKSTASGTKSTASGTKSTASGTKSPASGTTDAYEEPPDKAPAARLARSIDCIDYERQQHSPLVSSQGTCRIGIHRVYVQTFGSRERRDLYVRRGPAVEAGGINVMGSRWIVHVDDRKLARSVQADVGGRLAFVRAP